MKILLVLEIAVIVLLLILLLKLYLKNLKLVQRAKGAEKAERWHELAYTDVLTGLYNRNAYDKYVSDIECKKIDGDFLIALFDIDDFKIINDEKGHIEGDNVLQYVAKIVLFCNIVKHTVNK